MAGTENWFVRWLEERARYPRWLLARVREPVREGDEVTVEVLRDVDRRASLGLPLDLQHTNVSELPFCLFKEKKVDSECAGRLTTALCIVRSVQGVGFSEGLAFLSQLFLITGDWVRHRRGGSSILSQVGSSLLPSDPASLEGLTALKRLMDRPLYRILTLLDFWSLVGGRMVAGFAKSPDGRPGRACYIMIPPMWLGLDQLEEMSGDPSDEARIPLLVNARLAPVARSFIDFYELHSRLPGAPKIDLLFSTAPEQQETSEPDNVFRRDGHYWTLKYKDKTVRLRDSRGLSYIAHLLRNPGREFHALQMVGAVRAEGGSRLRGAAGVETLAEPLSECGLTIRDSEDGQDIIDRQTVNECRQRIIELEAELQEAKEYNDIERVAKIAGEIQTIESYLQRALGLGGRIRKGPTAAERARKAASMAIARALGIIEQQHPALWRYLVNSIRTGTTFSYSPDSPHSWVM